MMHIWYGARSVGHRTSSEEDKTSTDAASRRVVPMPKQSMCRGLQTHHNVQLLILSEIALVEADSPIATHLSVVRSVICHTRAPGIDCSTDLDTIWQVHLWGPIVLETQRKGGYASRTLSQTRNCKYLLQSGEYERGVGWTTCQSDSALCKNYVSPRYYSVCKSYTKYMTKIQIKENTKYHKIEKAEKIKSHTTGRNQVKNTQTIT